MGLGDFIKGQFIDVIEHVNMFIDDGLSQMEAIKKVAKLRNVPKSEIYNKFHR